MNAQDELKILWAARLGLNTQEVCDAMELSDPEIERLQRLAEAKLIETTVKASR